MVSRAIRVGGKRIDPIRIATGTNIMFRKMIDKDNNVEEVAIISGSQEAVMCTSHLIRAAIADITNQTASAQASAQALNDSLGSSPAQKKSKF